ncbi:hypothetical protein [Streptomyces sp. NPDC058657]|uniref:hypothetical protein n=1 Tax=unclassified Streptomyces TaxID=2593676 RepID=UPI00364ABCAD
MADRVAVDLCDYRHVRGTYDAVARAITMPHERMLAIGRNHTWISKYIFPGGLIPSMTATEAAGAAFAVMLIVFVLAAVRGSHRLVDVARDSPSRRWPSSRT